jgi:hypothetical protein
MKTKALALAIGAALVLSTAGRAADAPATQPLSPEIGNAINQLSADDYQERQHAVGKIQQALADTIRQLLLLDDPEARNRMSAIMEFNAGLSRWAMDVMQMTKEQRDPMVTWGTLPENAPLIAKLYSTRAEQRLDGIKDLAKRTEPPAAVLLAALIRDDDRAIRLSAIAAARDRPIHPAITDALWTVATTQPGNGIRRLNINGGQVNIVGNGRLAIGGITYFGNQTGEQDAAAEALIHLKDPSVPARVRAFLESPPRNALGDVRFAGVMANDSTQRVLNIAGAYQVTEALPALMKIVTGPVTNANSFNFNGQSSYFSNRTAAMAAVCLISGQQLEEYNLHKLPQGNQGVTTDQWATNDAAAEGQAADRLANWYAKYQQKPATAPATQAGR